MPNNETVTDLPIYHSGKGNHGSSQEIKWHL